MTTTADATHYPAAIIAAGPAAVAAWDDFTASGSFRASTRRMYRGGALRFLHWLEPQGIGLAQVTPRLVERFLNEKDLSPNSKATYRTALRRFLDALVARGAIAANPADEAGLGTGEGWPQARYPVPAFEETPANPPALAELTAFVHDLDNIDEGSESFRPALVAMYPIVVGGMDPTKIAAFTGIPIPEVELYAGRLRESGIWTPDGKISVSFENPDTPEAILELVLQVGCARGIYQRGPMPDDEGSDKQDSADGSRGEEHLS